MQNRLMTKNLFRTNRRGFTLVETVAALALLTIMISSVLVLMNRFVDAVIDMRLRQSAFEVARSNMETLLSETKLSETNDYGESEANPAIRWETIVEPFYEPYKDRMWIRAICLASFIDSKGQEQDVELEHWITSLTAVQIKQILAQQRVESEYMDLIQGGNLSDAQQTTFAYLEQEGLDVGGYQKLLKQQLRLKLEYLNKNGLAGYDKYLEQLQDEENEFLDNLGMNFDAYNEFAESYVPPATESQPDTELENPDEINPDVEYPIDESKEKSEEPQKTVYTPDDLRAMGIPEELIPWLLSLFNQQ